MREYIKNTKDEVIVLIKRKECTTFFKYKFSKNRKGIYISRYEQKGQCYFHLRNKDDKKNKT